MINRLHDVMTSVFPTLEQQFDYSSHKGALILLIEYASPKRLRRLGETRLMQWLHRRQVRDAARVAARALAAARGQDIELPGQHAAEMIITELATSLLQLDQRVQGLDQQIAATFRRHHQAMTIESMPGFGPILGAQLLVAAGDLRAWPLQLAWCRSPTTLADDPATCTNRAVTADRCGTSSICPRRPA
jgi:hypothetical protein